MTTPEQHGYYVALLRRADIKHLHMDLACRLLKRFWSCLLTGRGRAAVLGTSGPGALAAALDARRQQRYGCRKAPLARRLSTSPGRSQPLFQFRQHNLASKTVRSSEYREQCPYTVSG